MWDVVNINFTQHRNADVQQFFLSLAGRVHMTRAVGHSEVMCPPVKPLPAPLHHVLRVFTGIMMPAPEQGKGFFLSIKEVQL